MKHFFRECKCVMIIIYTLISNVVAMFGRSLFIVYRINSFLKARFLSQTNPCGIYGGQSHTRQSLPIFPVTIISPNAPYS
jgi:hypothetical protein